MPPAIVKLINSGTRAASTRKDLPFGGVQVVVLSSADTCPTQKAVARIFEKNGVVPSSIILTDHLRDEDSMEDTDWYAFQRSV